ncbi:MAG: hypothetical protein H6618_00800 [Deltaproteobacteria bacterium]|nr:hypothetical protein [Deltaproteobacteria bacterium]
MTVLKNKLIVIFLCLASLYLSGSPPAVARGQLSLPDKQQLRKHNLSFRSCRTEALKLMKDGRLSPRRFRARLTGCQERYPGASLYINCKKQAIQNYASDKPALKKSLAECSKTLLSAMFDPSRPLPFYLRDQKQFFAGVGFTRVLSGRELSLPNFDCRKLQSLAYDTRKAEYFLFGNDASLFQDFRGLKEAGLEKILKTPATIPPEGHYVRGLGKVFKGGRQNDRRTLYFPTGSCVFEGDLGPHFAGLSAYYFVDQARKRFIPYFAAAFYSSDFQSLSTKDASFQMLKMMSESGVSGDAALQVFSHTEAMSIIAAQKITEFDQEGDPANLCAAPRSHQLLALVKGRNEKLSQLEYIILANIRHLCQFGDMVSKDLSSS